MIVNASSIVQNVIQTKNAKNDMCRCKCKKQSVCKKDSSTCTCEINAYFKSIVNDSVITCSRIINVTDTVLINSGDKKINYKIICYILRTFFISNHIAIHNRNYLLLYKIYV